MTKTIARAALALLLLCGGAWAQTDTPTATPTETPTETPTNTPTNTPTVTPTQSLCGVVCDAAPGTPCATPVRAAIDGNTARAFAKKQIQMQPRGTPGAVSMQWGCKQCADCEIVWVGQPTPATVTTLETTELSCESFWCRIQACATGRCIMDGFVRTLGAD